MMTNEVRKLFRQKPGEDSPEALLIWYMAMAESVLLEVEQGLPALPPMGKWFDSEKISTEEASVFFWKTVRYLCEKFVQMTDPPPVANAGACEPISPLAGSEANQVESDEPIILQFRRAA